MSPKITPPWENCLKNCLMRLCIVLILYVSRQNIRNKDPDILSRPVFFFLNVLYLIYKKKKNVLNG